MKRKFTTTLDADLIKRMKIDAVENDASVANLLEELIKKYLKDNVKVH